MVALFVTSHVRDPNISNSRQCENYNNIASLQLAVWKYGCTKNGRSHLIILSTNAAAVLAKNLARKVRIDTYHHR